MENNTYTLGRIVEHDTRSLSYGFNTEGLSIISVVHNRLIPILNQGQTSSCTGNAGIGSINTSPFVQDASPYYSPDENGALKLYSDAEKIDGGIGYPPEDKGSSGLSIAKALQNAGIISAFQHTFTLNDALMAGSLYPFITGISWYSDMFTPDADGRVHPTGTVVGGHEIELSEIDVPNGKIWFFNSWGDAWGQQGRFYLTWEDFSTLLDQQGDVVVLIPVAVTPPAPVPMPVLRIGSKGVYVKTLQTDLNKFGATLVVDGDFGPLTYQAVKTFQTEKGLLIDGIVGNQTWTALQGAIPPVDPHQVIIDTITTVCNQNGVEPLLGISVATCESSLNPNATLYNPGSNSTDRGLFQWNSLYHKEISDAQAFNPTDATQLFCEAVKAGNLHNYWSASEPCWKPKLTPAIIAKYGL